MQTIYCMAILTSVGCEIHNQKQTASAISVTQNEYTETDDILNYKYGITDSIRKRIFLSELAFHYALENDKAIDSIVLLYVFLTKINTKISIYILLDVLIHGF